MSTKRERRTFSDEFKSQIVQLFNAGKSKSDICREYELTPTVIDRWIKRINATGSAKESDNRTPEEIELDETALKDAVETVFNQNRKVYGSRKIKAVLKRLKIIVSRRKIIRIMAKKNLHSAYSIPQFKVHQGKVNDSQISNVLNRQFTGHSEYAAVVSDLTYVRVNYKWNYTCLLVDLFNREIIGFSAGVHKNAELVYDAFATVYAHLSRIHLFHTDRGREFDDHIIDEVLNTFDISRSLSLKGCPYDNAVAEATFKIFKSEFVNGRNFESLVKLKIELADYVN